MSLIFLKNVLSGYSTKLVI